MPRKQEKKNCNQASSCVLFKQAKIYENLKNKITLRLPSLIILNTHTSEHNKRLKDTT